MEEAFYRPSSRESWTGETGENMKSFCKYVCVGLGAAWCLVAGGTSAWGEVDGNWEYSQSAFELCSGLVSCAELPPSENLVGGRCVRKRAFQANKTQEEVEIPQSMRNGELKVVPTSDGPALVFGGDSEVEVGQPVNFTVVAVNVPNPTVWLECGCFPEDSACVFNFVPPNLSFYPDVPGDYIFVFGCGDADYYLKASWTVTVNGGMAEITLQAQSANPAEGSLTLAWDDTATVEGVTYSVYRSANDTYSATDLVADGLTGTSWTDTAYWSAEPILKPLNYWVVADGGGYGERASKPLETRHRYGLCVGYDAYGVDSTPLRQSLADARLCHSLAESAGFDMEPVLENSEASIEGIHNALIALAQKAKPGDSVLFYIATHGGLRKAKDKAVLIAYDGQYNVTQLASDVAAFDTGVSFIGIIMACHSQAMAGGFELSGAAANWLIENGLAMCTPNVAWVTSCGTDESSYNLEGSTQTMFGEWFLHQGWQNSHADSQLSGLEYGGVHGDGKISLLELTEYATLFARGSSDEKPSHVYFQNEEVLGKTIVADGISSTGTGGPDVPASITASQGVFDFGIEVSWAPANGALWYWLYVLKGGCSGESDADWKCLAYYKQNPKFMHKGSILGDTCQYRVRAVNGSGVSAPSPIAQGSRGTAAMLNWLQEKGKELGLLVGGAVAELAAMQSANGMSLEGCYVSGIDPLDPDASFEAELVREDGKWKAKPKGGEKEGRVYRVEGKKEMSDEVWTDVTDVEDLEADGWHFFRVGVELAE